MPDTCPPSNLAAIDAAHHLQPFADIKKLNAYWPEIDRICKARNILLWQWGALATKQLCRCQFTVAAVG